jgi:hypothetical protein
MHYAIIRLDTEIACVPPAKRAVAPELSRPDRANGQVFCLLSVPYISLVLLCRAFLLIYLYLS